MATFEYRCERCGVFVSRFPVGGAPSSTGCLGCGVVASRIFSAPALLSGRSALTRAMDDDRRSAHEPAVVNAPPPRGPRVRASQNHLHARLPRP